VQAVDDVAGRSPEAPAALVAELLMVTVPAAVVVLERPAAESGRTGVDLPVGSQSRQRVLRRKKTVPSCCNYNHQLW